MLEESFVETPPYGRPFGLANRLRRDLSDADLVGELVKNRPEAQRLAVRRFAPHVRRLLLRSLGSESEIDDIQQEVFWCLFRRIHVLKEPGALRPFVMAIALRGAFHEHRRRRRSAHIALEPELALIGPPTKRDEAVASHALVRLGKLISLLRKRERETFVLRFVEGMTVTEISKALKLTEPTTRRSCARAWLSVRKRALRDPFLCDYFGSGHSLPDID